MATSKQITALERLAERAYQKAGNELGYSVLELTDGTPYADLPNAKVTALMNLYNHEINARRCEHCHEKISDADRANHSLVRYYDDVYGPNCGLS